MGLQKMRTLALDVFYREGEPLDHARAAAVLFDGQGKELAHYHADIENVAPYQAGKFYLRELPCLLAVLEQVNLPFEQIAIDGFVYLDDAGAEGLGAHLYHRLNQRYPVIGIAKKPFRNMGEAYCVYRGRSQRPLYVTAAGMALEDAKQWVRDLSGNGRIPEILARVDRLSRQTDEFAPSLHK